MFVSRGNKLWITTLCPCLRTWCWTAGAPTVPCPYTKYLAVLNLMPLVKWSHATVISHDKFSQNVFACNCLRIWLFPLCLFLQTGISNSPGCCCDLLVHYTKLFLKEVTFVLFNWNVRMEQLVHFGGTAQRDICVPILTIHIGTITFL